MKAWLLISLIIGLNFGPIHSLTGQSAPQKLFKTWISVRGKEHRIKGALYETRDSSILVSSSYQKTDYFKGNYDITKLKVRDITSITVQRDKPVGHGIMIGSLSGLGFGLLMGLATTTPGGNDRSQAETKLGAAIFFGILMGTCGIVVGAALGTIRKKMNIHGSQAQYDDKKGKLLKRSLTYDPLMTGQRLTSFSRLRGSVADVDGNVYHVVALGSMVFLEENLKVTRFRNGKEIPFAGDTASWRNAIGAAYCNYRNDSANVSRYGRLYNGNVIADTSGICPAGWHVPSFGEWTSLIMCLGGNGDAGGFMKEAGTRLWSSPNRTMYTENTFALPSGSRDPKGVFAAPGRICGWWIAKDKDKDGFRGFLLSNESMGITITTPDRRTGLSVRCMRDN